MGLLGAMASCRATERPGAPAASQNWGPLAVVEDATGDEALISGILQITDTCVLLDEQGESVLLVWPQDRTMWDGEETAVAVTEESGHRVELRDGDTVTFGGGGSSLREGGTTADEFLESVAWVSKPDADCVVDVRWFIGDLITDGAS